MEKWLYREGWSDNRSLVLVIPACQFMSVSFCASFLALTYNPKDSMDSTSFLFRAYLLFSYYFYWLRGQYQDIKAFPIQFHYLIFSFKWKENISLIFNSLFYFHFLWKMHNLMERKIRNQTLFSPKSILTNDMATYQSKTHTTHAQKEKNPYNTLENCKPNLKSYLFRIPSFPPFT
jgi:hypothetical protein